jgi:hypothetical protein
LYSSSGCVINLWHQVSAGQLHQPHAQADMPVSLTAWAVSSTWLCLKIWNWFGKKSFQLMISIQRNGFRSIIPVPFLKTKWTTAKGVSNLFSFLNVFCSHIWLLPLFFKPVFISFHCKDSYFWLSFLEQASPHTLPLHLID